MAGSGSANGKRVAAAQKYMSSPSPVDLVQGTTGSYCERLVQPGTNTERAAVASGIQAIIDREFPPDRHPYRLLESAILRHVDGDHTVLDVGCGRGAPNLLRLKGHAKTLIGIDLVSFEIADPELHLINADVCDMPVIASGSVDIVYSRSVMEHIADTMTACAEIHRVLKPGGKYIFLTPNAWDYVSVIAKVVPNRFHPQIVRMTSGRAETDVFPTFYTANTYRQIKKIAKVTGFELRHFEYLGQYPASFAFSSALFRIATRYEKFLERHRRLQFLRGWIFCIMYKRSGKDLPHPTPQRVRAQGR